MAKGLPKWAIKQARKAKARNVFAYAWSLVKRRGRKRPKRLKTTRRTSKRRRRMPRRKRRRRSGFGVRSIMKFVRLGALAAPAVGTMLDPSVSGGHAKAERILALYTGYAMNMRRFEWQWLVRGWTPYIVACLVTHGVPKIAGLIRRL